MTKTEAVNRRLTGPQRDVTDCEERLPRLYRSIEEGLSNRMTSCVSGSPRLTRNATSQRRHWNALAHNAPRRRPSTRPRSMHSRAKTYRDLHPLSLASRVVVALLDDDLAMMVMPVPARRCLLGGRYRLF
jgi:hypothetical protein